MNEISKVLITAVCTLVPCFVGFIVSWIKSRQQKIEQQSEIDSIKQAQRKQEIEIEQVKKQASILHLFVNCPKCGEEIDLSKVEIKQRGVVE